MASETDENQPKRALILGPAPELTQKPTELAPDVQQARLRVSIAESQPQTGPMGSDTDENEPKRALALGPSIRIESKTNRRAPLNAQGQRSRQLSTALRLAHVSAQGHDAQLLSVLVPSNTCLTRKTGCLPVTATTNAFWQLRRNTSRGGNDPPAPPSSSG